MMFRLITRPLLTCYSKDVETQMEANAQTYCVLSGSHNVRAAQTGLRLRFVVFIVNVGLNINITNYLNIFS